MVSPYSCDSTNVGTAIFSNAIYLMDLIDRASTDLQLCADGVTFYAHRAVLAPKSEYVSEFLRSPLRRVSSTGSISVYISLPPLDLSRELCSTDVAPIKAFEAFLGACYKDEDLGRLRPHELLAVAIIADFMVSQSILAAVDEYAATMEFSVESWMAALMFCKRIQLPMTTKALLEKQSVGQFQILARSELFFRLEEIEFLAIIRNTNLSTLVKIFAVFWFCSGLSSDEFERKDRLQVRGTAKSCAFTRFLGDIIQNIQDKTTLGLLTDMLERFELIYDSGRPYNMLSLYKIITKKALQLSR